MKQTFFGEERWVLQNRIKNRILICVLIMLTAVVVNVFLTLLHTPENHTVLIAANTLVDVAAGWIAVWNLDTCVLPGRKLLRLYAQSGVKLCGTVEEISESTERYCGFDCYVVTIAGHRVFVIDNGSIQLTPSQQVTVETVHGIVKEVEL